MTASDPPDLQSPIDLVDGQPIDAPRLAVDLRSSSFKTSHIGWTLSIEPADAGTVWVGSRRLTLGEVHFHHPSDHTVEGRRAAAEVHLVHTDEDGRLGVLAVLLEEGAENAEIAKLLANAPDPDCSRSPRDRFDPVELLPKERATWRYEGSRTTPPYTSGVSWFVFTTPMTASADQLASLRSAFPPNARAIQDRAGRPLWCCA